MAKIIRSTAYPFGSSAGANEMITFGSLAAGAAVFYTGSITPAEIMGVTFTFTISSASATVGATYTDSVNSQTFTVTATISSQTTLVCTGTGTPGASGTLTKASGTGSATLTYSSFTAAPTTQYLGSWYSAVVGSTNSPTIQDMNALFSLQSNQIAYQLQAGIPEFDAATTYYQYSICQSSGIVYQYINVTGSTGNAPPNGTYWNIISRDSNSNFSANNLIDGFATTATAAGTTTLTVASAAIQQFTGTTTQTVKMPVTSTLVAGQQYTVLNNSTGVVTVASSGSNTIQAMNPGTSLSLVCVLITGTGTASWEWSYSGLNANGPTKQILTYQSGTFTGNATSGSPTLTSVSSFTNLYVGMGISGTDIPGGAYITALNVSGSTLTMSANATGGSNTTVTVTQSGAGTYILPTGCKSIKVTVIGDGAGGGGCASSASTSAAGGGGGGGGTCIKWISNPSSTYSFSVGQGGGAGSAGNNSGGNGNGTTFSTMSAGGGNGGSGGPAISVPTLSGSASSGGSASGGDVNSSGGSSGYGITFGSAGVTNVISGFGGSSTMGAGGFPTNGNSAGNAGLNYGGGGSGGSQLNNGGTKAGGAGAPGIIIIEESY